MIRAYEVGLRGQDHWTTVHAATAGKAKYSFWMDVRDCLEVKYIDVVSRVADSLFVQTDEFQRTAKYRGVPFARIGMKAMTAKASSLTRTVQPTSKCISLQVSTLVSPSESILTG